MATFHNTYNLDLTVLANYTALMGDIHDQIIAMGWVQTADSGQTDPGSVGAVPSAGTFGNYAVYKTNDGLTTTYLRIAYGQSGGPQFRVQIGASTDGAGNLSGNTSDSQDPQISLTSAGQDVYVSGGTGRIMIAVAPANNGGHNQLIVVERSHDANGADTSNFSTIIGFGWGSGYWQHSVPLTGTNSVRLGRASCINFSPVSGTGWQLGGNDQISPVVPWVPAGNSQPLKDVVVCGGTTDFTPNTTTLVPTFGANHTYLVTPVGASTSVGSPILLARYE